MGENRHGNLGTYSRDGNGDNPLLVGVNVPVCTLPIWDYMYMLARGCKHYLTPMTGQGLVLETAESTHINGQTATHTTRCVAKYSTTRANDTARISTWMVHHK